MKILDTNEYCEKLRIDPITLKDLDGLNNPMSYSIVDEIKKKAQATLENHIRFYLDNNKPIFVPKAFNKQLYFYMVYDNSERKLLTEFVFDSLFIPHEEVSEMRRQNNFITEIEKLGLIEEDKKTNTFFKDGYWPTYVILDPTFYKISDTFKFKPVYEKIVSSFKLNDTDIKVFATPTLGMSNDSFIHTNIVVYTTKVFPVNYVNWAAQRVSDAIRVTCQNFSSYIIKNILVYQ